MLPHKQACQGALPLFRKHEDRAATAIAYHWKKACERTLKEAVGVHDTYKPDHGRTIELRCRKLKPEFFTELRKFIRALIFEPRSDAVARGLEDVARIGPQRAQEGAIHYIGQVLTEWSRGQAGTPISFTDGGKRMPDRDIKTSDAAVAHRSTKAVSAALKRALAFAALVLARLSHDSPARHSACLTVLPLSHVRANGSKHETRKSEGALNHVSRAR